MDRRIQLSDPKKKIKIHSSSFTIAARLLKMSYQNQFHSPAVSHELRTCTPDVLIHLRPVKHDQARSAISHVCNFYAGALSPTTLQCPSPVNHTDTRTIKGLTAWHFARSEGILFANRHVLQIQVKPCLGLTDIPRCQYPGAGLVQMPRCFTLQNLSPDYS